MFFKNKQEKSEIQSRIYVIKDILSNTTTGDPFYNKTDIAVQRELLNFIKSEKEKNNEIRVRELQLYRIGDITTDMHILSYEPQYICSLADLEANIDNYLKSQGL